MTVPPPPPPLELEDELEPPDDEPLDEDEELCWAAKARAAACLGPLGRRCLQLCDLVLEAARGALELRLQREHLLLAVFALGHEPDGRLAILLQGQAAVGDLPSVRPRRARRLCIALRHALHDVELGEQVVERVRGEDDIEDPGAVGLVHLAGARREVIVGHAELVLGDLEQLGVAGDAALHVLQPGGGFVVPLHGDSRLLVDLGQLRLDGLELLLLGLDGTGRSSDGQCEDDEQRAQTEEGRLADGGQTDRLLRAG